MVDYVMPPDQYIFRNNFPLEFQKALVSRETDQAGLLRAMERRGYRVTKQFMNMMARGERRVPANQLRKICEVLQLSEQDRHRLHLAAARDCGYDLSG